MNIKDKDLNLLNIFEAIMTDLNLSKAAKRLNVTQPALSNALARLRSDFDDPLFVRSSHGMVPTPRAHELKEEVGIILRHAETLYHDTQFQPARITGRFTLATTDFFEHLLLPKLLPYLGTHAPNLCTVIRPTLGSLPKVELETGTVDLAVAGFFGELQEGFYQRKVVDETYSCVVRKDHPLVKDHLTLEIFLQLEHILVSPQGDLVGVVDRVLAEKKLTRKVVAGVANFHTPAAIIAASDYIVTVPTRIAKAYADLHPVVCFPPPLKVPGFKLVQVWHERTHKSPKHVWMRRAIEVVLSGT